MEEHSRQGEAAIVTGSDSGIGQAIAVAFAHKELVNNAGIDSAGIPGKDIPLKRVNGGLMQFMGQGA